MKNTIKVLGIVAIAAVIGFSFVACGDDGPDPDKTIVITGLSGKTGDVGVLILDSYSPWHSVAGGVGKISGDSVTVNLGANDTRWNGSGSYYVGCRLITEDVPYKYTNGTSDWVKVSITEARTTVDFKKFVPE